MYVAEVVCQEDHCYSLRDFAIVRFRLFAFENADTERNHVYDIEFISAHFAVVVLLVAEYRDICEMKLIM